MPTGENFRPELSNAETDTGGLDSAVRYGEVDRYALVASYAGVTSADGMAVALREKLVEPQSYTPNPSAEPNRQREGLHPARTAVDWAREALRQQTVNRAANSRRGHRRPSSAQ